MTSLHLDRAFAKALKHRAAASATRDRWDYLTSMSKRELAEILCHLAALCTDSYDCAIISTRPDEVLDRVKQERAALKDNGLI